VVEEVAQVALARLKMAGQEFKTPCTMERHTIGLAAAVERHMAAEQHQETAALAVVEEALEQKAAPGLVAAVLL
jgi:hypothetical protein